jgi:PIN domain nuclease of toxin-antitoxin system
VTDSVLDASALLAFLLNEPGADRVRPALPTAIISAVNLAETYGKLVRYGKRLEDAAALIGRLRLRVVPFDTDQARIAVSLWEPTRAAGLALGDRACLALALSLEAPAVTADSRWAECDLGGIRLLLIR